MVVDEAKRSPHDALSVLSQTEKEIQRVVLGGPRCSEMRMNYTVEEAAQRVVGKKAIAVEAYGQALRQTPMILSFLADNAGYDSSDLVSRLRAAHYDGHRDAGSRYVLCADLYCRLYRMTSSCQVRYERRPGWIDAGVGDHWKL